MNRSANFARAAAAALALSLLSQAPPALAQVQEAGGATSGCLAPVTLQAPDRTPRIVVLTPISSWRWVAPGALALGAFLLPASRAHVVTAPPVATRRIRVERSIRQ